jgi:hypothetical protein
VATIWQVQQHGEPAGPFHDRADRGPVVRADDQIAFPVAGYGTVGGLGRALIEHPHVHQRAGAVGVGPSMRPATPSAGAQHRGQLPAQPSELRPVDRLVDRLGDEVAFGVVGELPAQRLADLLGTPPLLQPVLHEIAQHRVAEQLAAPGAGPTLAGPLMRSERPVLAAGLLTVASQLPADRRGVASEFLRDRPHTGTSAD